MRPFSPREVPERASTASVKMRLHDRASRGVLARLRTPATIRHTSGIPANTA